MGRDSRAPQITADLLAWFARTARDLPWRRDRTPYRVWVAEALLQQTRVETAVAYYERFLARFPTLETLAAAPLEHVLQVWEGLGYYSRARNLHRAAGIVLARYHGRLPSNLEDLRQLPGIGPYTAAAIASIAYGQPVPAIDGNVLRTFARFYGIVEDIRKRKSAQAIANRLTPLIQTVNPSHFNQAIMEVGALVCKPRTPLCGRCLLARECVAFRTGRTAELPFSARRPPVPYYRVAVGVVWKDSRILIARRDAQQMLGGLWEFPGGKLRRGETLRAAAAREIREETGLTVRVGKPYGTFKHAYSHFRVTLTAFHCKWITGRPRPRSAVELKWIRPRQLGEFPFPRANRRIAEAILEAQAEP